MTNSIITESELNDALCYDFSIQTSEYGIDFLILICKTKEVSAKLTAILLKNSFDLRIFVDELTGNYSLEFYFIDLEMYIRFDTGKNETTYPPLVKLKNKEIKFITTGVWVGRTSKGRSCEYDPHLIRLGSFDIGDSFKQANEIQFIPGTTDDEPSAVILIYDNYDHIFKAEADEAYNRLMELTIGQPLLEINLLNQETLNLKIWDILIDLNVQFDGLKFFQKQLNDFIKKTDVKDSFAFAIGFRPSDGEKAAIASTKREGFKLITLKGYILKNIY
jgi:hypothetical protein